jgi:sec-independent protein translocase protein TatC
MSRVPDTRAAHASEKPFLEHLEDLRKTIIVCGVWLAGGMLIAIPFAPKILSLLKVPFARSGHDPDDYLKVIHLAGGLSVGMKIVFWTGLIIGMSGIVAAVCKFVFPGLTEKERRTVTGAIGFAVLLFVAGVSMCYFMTLHVAIRVLMRITEIMGSSPELIELGDYVVFVLKLMLAFGIAFELPVVILALGHMGLVSSNLLRKKRRHVIVGLAALAMLLTPQDPYTMVLMALPLVLLYEGCIWIIYFKERRDTRRFEERMNSE